MDPSRMTKREHATYVACSQIVDVRRFIPEVRQKKDPTHLSPDDLKEHLHAGIHVEVPIDLSEIKYVPMWHINGSLQTNASKCALYCPFEVLIHLLAKRFVDFKAKLLTLASVDIQLAVAQGEKLDDYTSFRKYQLVEACKAKDDKIDKLINMVAEQGKQNTILIQQNIDLKHDLATANELLDTLINMNVDDKGTVDDIRSDLDQAKDTLAQMKDGIAQVRNEVGSLAVKDQKMLKKDYLIIYRSNTKPAQAHVRERIEPEQIWLATFNGRLTSYKYPDIPIDAVEIYRIESNRLDSYDYLMSKQQIKDLIIKEFQRSWLVAQANVEELINRIEAELNANNQFESVRHLEALAIHVDEQPIDEQPNPIVKRKEELINQYDLKLRVIVNGWKRRVYAKNENGELIDLESVPNPTNTRWYYRYGRGGANVAYIGKRSIQALNFTDQTDARITYE